MSFTTERSSMYGDDLIIVVHNYDMPLKDDISELLDKCVLLNTYLSKYFIPCDYIKGFNIYYRVDCFEDKRSMYESLAHINYSMMNYDTVSYLPMHSYFRSDRSSLFVNELVLENTRAGDKVLRQGNCEYTEYDFVFTKLSENLNKEVSET